MSLSNSEFTLMFIIATIGMLLMAVAIISFIVFYQKKMLQQELHRERMEAEFQKKMLQAALDSQENERRRLAGDLHDSIGAMLSAIRVGLATLVRKQAVEEAAILPTKEMLDETIASVRAISWDLMPSTLEKFGLSQGLSEMCNRIAHATGLDLSFEEKGTARRLSARKENMLFRIVQELLNNALKHSGANAIHVKLHFGQRYLYIIVSDNGKGFDYQKQKGDRSRNTGLGLFNIENRARLMGANMTFDTGPSRGSKISIRLALTHEKQD